MYEYIVRKAISYEWGGYVLVEKKTHNKSHYFIYNLGDGIVGPWEKISEEYFTNRVNEKSIISDYTLWDIPSEPFTSKEELFSYINSNHKNITVAHSQPSS